MKTYKARDLLEYSEDDMWAIDNGPIELIFDLGIVIQTTGRETIISSYGWDVHRQYPHTPLLPRHHIHGTRFSSDSYLNIMSHAVWNCKDVYVGEVDLDDEQLCQWMDLVTAQTHGELTPVDMDDMSKLAYDIANQCYNSLSIRLEEYPTSMDALDWVEVLDHPPIAEFREKMYAAGGLGFYNPDAFNELVKKELSQAPTLSLNGVATVYRGKQASPNQVAQCGGSRGRAMDITSDIFREPILGGFATGMDNIKDMAKESRSASLSAYFQKDPMKKSEYFNRNIQLSSATLARLHYVDCGSRHYITITIASSKVLQDAVGIAYLDEELGCERIIRRHMRHLVGKNIRIRSVLTCQHPDRGGVCVRCFGELGYSIPLHTNIGHVSSSEMQSKVGQLLLSNKHYLASAIIVAMQIQAVDAIYITSGPEENHLYMTERFQNIPYSVIVKNREAVNLGDVRVSDNVNTLSPFRMSSLTTLHFQYEVDGFEQTASVDCTIGSRNASLSSEFLHHVKRVGYRTSDEGDYIVDMSTWDIKDPILELPLKHFSTLDYMVAIEKFIKGGEAKEKCATMVNQESHERAVMALSDLISSRLDVNFSYIQTIYLAALVQSRRDRDYRLPMPRYEGQPAHYRQIMRQRSIAATMAFQEQTTALFGLESYLLIDRPVHPFDDLVFG